VAAVVRVTLVADNDSIGVYATSATELVTNDARYHSVRLTRRHHDVTLAVDNLAPPHRLTGTFPPFPLR